MVELRGVVGAAEHVEHLLGHHGAARQVDSGEAHCLIETTQSVGTI